jgi:hypothetical protein
VVSRPRSSTSPGRRGRRTARQDSLAGLAASITGVAKTITRKPIWKMSSAGPMAFTAASATVKRP